MLLNLRRIKAERIAKGLTQDEMSDKLGWNGRSKYAKRENGLVPFRIDELIAIADILGYEKDEIHIFFKNIITIR